MGSTLPFNLTDGNRWIDHALVGVHTGSCKSASVGHTYTLFIMGCVMSMVSDSWFVTLAARVLQGFGAAAPRIVTVALVREGEKGRAMARIVSIVIGAFVVVPIIAPAIGLGFIHLGGRRLTFLGLAVLAILVLLWFARRQPETLMVQERAPFALWKSGKVLWRFWGRRWRIVHELTCRGLCCRPSQKIKGLL